MLDAAKREQRLITRRQSGGHDSVGAHIEALEKWRLQEISKFFFSAWQTTGLLEKCDIDARSGYDPTTARLSADPVLNALAQLAAHRLSCSRAFISIIDDEHQFLIAEATKGISLYDVNHHPEDNDELCLGARPLDLLAGVCAGTMPAFVDTLAIGPYKSTANIYADRDRYIINDFGLEEKYKDRPYVIGFPHMHYYAEVPIRLSSGEVIGTLAVVDDKPRQGLSDEGFFALTEIAKTIMVHLEKVKMEQDHVQASKLLWGLNAFLEDSAAKQQSYHQESTSLADVSSQVRDPTSETPAVTNFGLDTSTTYQSYASRSEMKSNGAEVSIPMSESHQPVLLESESLPIRPRLRLASPQSLKTETSTQPKRNIGEHLKSLTISDEIRSKFSSASQILCRAMDLDGVVFLDAGFTDFASRTDISAVAEDFAPPSATDRTHTYSLGPSEAGPRPPTESASAGAAPYEPSIDHLTESVEHASSRIPTPARTKPKMSARLGYHTRQLFPATDDATRSSDVSLPEVVHQSLLHHYSNGHVFDFNQDDVPLDRGEQIPIQQTDSGNGIPLGLRLMQPSDIDVEIRRAIPHVRSAVFIPLWSPHKEAWFAGGLGWTTKDRQILEQDDLAYFSVFGNSIMAELTRLDLFASDQAKSNFISSISHELRSPLHGILGTAELLKDGPMDSSQQKMIGMIENCGHTLLDTVEHILDYAKISMTAPTSRTHHRVSNTPSQGSSGSHRLGVMSTFDLSVVLEDTVESTVAGYHYSTALAKRSSDELRASTSSGGSHRTISSGTTNGAAISVVVDIENSSNWQVETESAAWRRIILNLLGNALKYTEEGLVEVILRARSIDESVVNPPSRRMTSLTVRDTGRGIGKEFLENHLFTPFVQENGLSAGTGLGLSIVQKIVHDLQGTLKVHSEVGVGTQIDVIVPLTIVSTPQSVAVMHPSKGTFCLLGFISSEREHTPAATLPATSKTAIALRTALGNYAKNWLGLEVTSSSQGDQITADIIAIQFETLHLLQKDSVAGSKSFTIPRGSSLLVITEAQNDLKGHEACKAGRIRCLTYPFGPRRTSEAILAGLHADRSEALQLSETLFATGPLFGEQRALSINGTHPSSSGSLSAIPPQAHSPLPTPPPDYDAEVAPGDSQKLNLLIVDDNEINLRMLVAFARKLCCSYSTATNGQGAVDLYVNASGQTPESTPFDYILMDVSMPVMDGFASTRAIREFERANDLAPTPIIALTGLDSADAQQEAFVSGVDLFLTKPVPLNKIRILVEQGLDALRMS